MDATEVLAWLRAGDPAVVWQVERDLLRSPATRYERTRSRVAKSGWGAELIAKRAPDGTWAGGLYNPKWTSTFYTLQLLAALGLGPDQPRCVESCRLLLDRGVEPTGAVRLWKSAPADTCVTAMMLSMSLAFGFGADPRTKRMLDWLLREQMPDGGWNCRFHRDHATHASFHTTTSVLEALNAWLAIKKSDRRAGAAAKAGRELMLAHRLYRSHRTGNIVRAAFTRLFFPTWWKFDVLRGLEVFRAANAWDERLADPIDLVQRRRGKDGRWRLPRPHPGRVWLSMESAGEPSRWNTLRALRVLRWAAAR